MAGVVVDLVIEEAARAERQALQAGTANWRFFHIQYRREAAGHMPPRPRQLMEHGAIFALQIRAYDKAHHYLCRC